MRRLDIAPDKRERSRELYSGNLPNARHLRRNYLLPRRLDEFCRTPKVVDKTMG